MSDFKNSKTIQNLINAFAGESQARNRYSYYAKVADKEGYKQISDFFLETADNERVHAKTFYKLILKNSDEKNLVLPVNGSYPVSLGSTLENLKAAAAGENEEWTELYPKFAKIAEEEGYKEIAVKFNAIVVAEKAHEKRYLTLASNIEKDIVFKRGDKVYWKCRKCGYVHESSAAPEVCPACSHPKNYFQLLETF